MEKYSETYTKPRTFGKYDATHIIGYLHEEIVSDYQPEGAGQPVAGYRYTGTERDGGTVMPCSNPQDYGQLTNAIIRAKYAESEEMAIHRHHGNDPVAYADEWQQYNQDCEAAKMLAKKWLGID